MCTVIGQIVIKNCNKKPTKDTQEKFAINVANL